MAFVLKACPRLIRGLFSLGGAFHAAAAPARGRSAGSPPSKIRSAAEDNKID